MVAAEEAAGVVLGIIVQCDVVQSCPRWTSLVVVEEPSFMCGVTCVQAVSAIQVVPSKHKKISTGLFSEFHLRRLLLCYRLIHIIFEKLVITTHVFC
jgi:hypothetical protein